MSTIQSSEGILSIEAPSSQVNLASVGLLTSIYTNRKKNDQTYHNLLLRACTGYPKPSNSRYPKAVIVCIQALTVACSQEPGRTSQPQQPKCDTGATAATKQSTLPIHMNYTPYKSKLPT